MFNEADASSGEKMCEKKDGVLKKECAHDGLKVVFFGEVWKASWMLC